MTQVWVGDEDILPFSRKREAETTLAPASEPTQRVCAFCGLPEGRCKATIVNIPGGDDGLWFSTLHRDAGYKTLELNPMVGVSAINRYVGKREPTDR